MKRVLGLLFALVVACSSDEDVTVPVKAAPSSRHDALRDALRDDTRAFAFNDGDWPEDLDDAPRFGLAWLAHQGAAPELDAAKAHAVALLDGDPVAVEKVQAAYGLLEYIVATGDHGVQPALDAYIDRIDAAGDYVTAKLTGEVGPTELTALIALLDVEATRLLGEDRRARAIAHDDAIRARAFGDFVDVATHGQARGYAFEPDSPVLSNTANIAMLILKARLFRLTKDLVYRVEARAIYGALQTFKLSEGRYSSPDAESALMTDARDLSLLSSEADLAFALTLLFEITGDDRFIQEADQIFDAIGALRGHGARRSR